MNIEEKKSDFDTIKNKIIEILNMNIIEYLKFTKKNKKNNKIKNEEESTIDESIETILKIKDLIENENNGINYEIDFG